MLVEGGADAERRVTLLKAVRGRECVRSPPCKLYDTHADVAQSVVADRRRSSKVLAVRTLKRKKTSRGCEHAHFSVEKRPVALRRDCLNVRR